MRIFLLLLIFLYTASAQAEATPKIGVNSTAEQATITIEANQSLQLKNLTQELSPNRLILSFENQENLDWAAQNIIMTDPEINQIKTLATSSGLPSLEIFLKNSGMPEFELQSNTELFKIIVKHQAEVSASPNPDLTLEVTPTPSATPTPTAFSDQEEILGTKVLENSSPTATSTIAPAETTTSSIIIDRSSDASLKNVQIPEATPEILKHLLENIQFQKTVEGTPIILLSFSAKPNFSYSSQSEQTYEIIVPEYQNKAKHLGLIFYAPQTHAGLISVKSEEVQNQKGLMELKIRVQVEIGYQINIQPVAEGISISAQPVQGNLAK